jgi:iron-sulfur cluster assembly accessory protein
MTEEAPDSTEDAIFDRLVIDVVSLDMIDGSTIDYEEEMVRKAFVVKENPKAELTCGCGASFSPRFN